MNEHFSFQKQWQVLLPKIILNPVVHGKWLNTLSYLENCGARKIAASEHPTLVKKETLKHAAEEFRHAHHLKKQLKKVNAVYEDYNPTTLIGGFSSIHYLDRLEIAICKFLQQNRIRGDEVKLYAYHLVTYAIEKRAEELYTLYNECLQKFCPAVSMKSILIEEKNHLEEMLLALQKIPYGREFGEKARIIETTLCKKWIDSLESSLEKFYTD